MNLAAEMPTKEVVSMIDTVTVLFEEGICRSGGGIASGMMVDVQWQ